VTTAISGLGYGMVILTGIVAIYYTVIMSWALYYLIMSFSSTLPWSHCNNTWNTHSCYSRVTYSNDVINNTNVTTSTRLSAFLNRVDNNSTAVADYNISTHGLLMNEAVQKMTPTEQFWE